MASLYFLLPLLYIICTIYFIKGVYIRVFTIFYFVVNFVYYLSICLDTGYSARGGIYSGILVLILKFIRNPFVIFYNTNKSVLSV